MTESMFFPKDNAHYYFSYIFSRKTQVGRWLKPTSLPGTSLSFAKYREAYKLPTFLLSPFKDMNLKIPSSQTFQLLFSWWDYFMNHKELKSNSNTVPGSAR